MKILLMDIETAPNRAFVWGLFDQNIGLNQLEASGYVLCWAAKFLDQKPIMFSAVHGSTNRAMLEGIHKLLDEADVVVHYNGLKFDIPTLNKEFIKHGMLPPSPYKQVDLFRVAKRAFRFESNKLDYIAQAIGIGQKVKHKGFELWVECMAGDHKAWKQMERYNKQDVRILEKLYFRLMPWIQNHPNLSAHQGILACPNCGSEKSQARGTQVALGKKYQRYQCQDCGRWYRGNKAIVGASKGERGVNIV